MLVTKELSYQLTQPEDECKLYVVKKGRKKQCFISFVPSIKIGACVVALVCVKNTWNVIIERNKETEVPLNGSITTIAEVIEK